MKSKYLGLAKRVLAYLVENLLEHQRDIRIYNRRHWNTSVPN